MSRLPEKRYYAISEVSELTDVKPHILRYWEDEFPLLRPRKNRAGNRAYRARDIKVVLVIKRLLRENQQSAGAVQKKLKDDRAFVKEQLDLPLEELLAPSDPIDRIKQDLKVLLKVLDEW